MAPAAFAEARLLVDARNTLGECPLWCDRSQALWWTDIEGAALHRLDPATGALERRPMRDRVGCFALCEDPDLLLLGLAGGIALHRLSTGATTPLVAVGADLPQGMRINDGRCDRQGRLVFGMFEPDSAHAPAGHWYRVHPDLRIERLPLPPARVANSLCFSLDGRRLYHADSPTRTVWIRDYHEDGRIGAAEVFVRLDEREGFPDGAGIDAEGGFWLACWQGRALRRYDARGQLTDVVNVPVSNVSSLAFGGAALDTLYITTARIGLRAEALPQQPAAGGLFAVTPGHRGVSEARFRPAEGASAQA